MYLRSLRPPKESFFLFGPRGTGKTTWLRQYFSKALWWNLLKESVFQNLLTQPSLFSNKLRTLPPHSWVVIDEVQRLPTLLNEVHHNIETQKLRFALTGSSARKLKHAQVNLLAGRARFHFMFPLFPRELGKDFQIEKILRYGSIPLIWKAPHKLRDYMYFYLKEEIQAEAQLRKLSGFSRSLPVMALFHGQVLNISSLARDAGVQRKTLEAYIQILEDTLLVQKLYPYQAKITVRERKKPKLYWIDPGIVRAAKNNWGPVIAEERGALLEGYVYQMIRHEIENTRRFHEVYYWAPSESNTEVDFLLKKEDSFFAIEVKASTHAHVGHLKGLRALARLPYLKKRYLVYLGTEIQKTSDGIEILPLLEFEKKLQKGL